MRSCGRARRRDQDRWDRGTWGREVCSVMRPQEVGPGSGTTRWDQEVGPGGVFGRSNSLGANAINSTHLTSGGPPGPTSGSHLWGPPGPTSGSHLRVPPPGPTSGSHLRVPPPGPTSGSHLRVPAPGPTSRSYLLVPTPGPIFGLLLWVPPRRSDF